MNVLNFLFILSLGIMTILVISNITDIQACTPYENCTRTLPHPTTQTAPFNGNHATYRIPYDLSNAKLVASLLDLPAKELIFRFNATGDGQLMVELSRSIIDSTRDGNDKPYLVFVGDMYSGTKRVQANEIQNTSSDRTLVINFSKKDNEIGIVGTFFIENNSTSKISNGYGAWSPLQQYEKGFDAQDIICKSDLILVIKSEDGSPACVTSNTTQKLMERGWTKNPTGVSSLTKPSIGIYNLTVSTNPIILGIPFYINAVIVNHQTEPITYYGGCTSPLSVSFDSIKTSTDNVHCLAISKYILEPNQSVPVQSDRIETLYNTTRPNTTTSAQIKFSYEADGKPTSMFISMQIPIQTAIMIDCSTNVLVHISQIDRTVNVTKAIALAHTSPEFAAKIKQYGNISYNYTNNDWFSSESCHTYWNGTEVMFTTNDKNGSRNIQVSEDINLTKVLKVKDFQVGFSK